MKYFAQVNADSFQKKFVFVCVLFHIFSTPGFLCQSDMTSLTQILIRSLSHAMAESHGPIKVLGISDGQFTFVPRT